MLASNHPGRKVEKAHSHPGFAAIQGSIAKKYEAKGDSMKKAMRIAGGALYDGAKRGAARKANPRLNKIKGI